MIACENSGHSIPDDFPEVRKIVEAGVTTKPKKDYELSRYACYLIVQNGDPRKEVIALGQTYFAIQTYRQEVADYFNELDEDNRRLVVRGDIKQWNQMLAETAHNAGVITNEEFAIFQNAGYMGLYGGLDVDDIQTKMLASTLEVEESDILKAVTSYTDALMLLDQYDHQSLKKPVGNRPIYKITYEECKKMVSHMEDSFKSDVFGVEKENGKVEGILAAVYQSVFGGDVYLSLEEKVANLLFNEIGNSQVV